MKTLTLRFLLVSALVAFVAFATPARAQENNANANIRIERLERRINEIAQKQQAPVPPPQVAKAHKAVKDFIGLCILCSIIFNILIAIWIFGDIRKRGTGSGIFVVLALIWGVPTAIIYALVRIGDNKLIEPVVRTV